LTSRSVSSQSEQPAVKPQFFFSLPFFHSPPLLIVFVYIPLQQHLSIVLPVSSHRSFPFFCFSQQHIFTSLPVRVQTIFGEAADPIVAITNAAINGTHFVISFIIHLLQLGYVLLSTPWSHVQGQPLFSEFAA
jgi:hypothetical protein